MSIERINDVVIKFIIDTWFGFLFSLKSFYVAYIIIISYRKCAVLLTANKVIIVYRGSTNRRNVNYSISVA